MIKGALFDLDGTLVDSIGCYRLAFSGGMRYFGIEPLDLSRVMALLDRGARIQDILAALLPSLDETMLATLRNKIVEIYIALEKEHIRLLPGAIDLLSNLKSRGLRTGVATSRVARGDGKWRDLQRFGLDAFIDVVVTAADFRPKPAPDTIVECVRQLGLVASECVYVGDSTCDIIAAREAGLVACAVTTGVGQKSALMAAGPIVVVDSLLELIPWFESISHAPGRQANQGLLPP
ncbi:MAG: HAD family hydrolase [Dehalococcoidia bacterium]|nr:HAD family hydrolase [Dehalococcoidia bacterium]